MFRWPWQTKQVETVTLDRTPIEIHGDGNCHICGKPKAGNGLVHCSYPHGMVPDEQVADGMFSWKQSEPDRSK